MEIILYNNASDARVLDKTLKNPTSIDGTLRENTSMIDPVINIQSDSVIRFNYARIPLFQRYYFINNVEVGPNGIYRLYMHVDVLMSFRGDIASWNVIIDKETLTEQSDTYIDDGTYVSKAIPFNQVYSYSHVSKFLDTPFYVLITAG